MTKLEFAEHFAGLLRCCGDGYIKANLDDALERYLDGRSAREPAKTVEHPQLRDPYSNDPL